MARLKNEIGIRCLRCGQSQLPPNRATLDNWNCGYCYSGFLSIAMLTNLVSRDILRQVTRRKPGSGDARPCPRCHLPMQITEAVAQENDVHVQLEHCRPCHLLWFDAGAITKLLRLQPHEFFSASEPTPPPRPAAPTKTTAPKAESFFFPFATIGLFAVCAALMPVAVKFPTVAAKLAFLPFLNLPSQMHAMLPLLLFGSFAEKRLGPQRLFQLFLFSGLFGRLVYMISGGEPGIVGSGQAVAGVAVYALLTARYHELFSPSSRSGAMGWLVAAIFVVNVYLAWDFFHVSFRQAGVGAGGAGGHGTVIVGLKLFLQTPWARGTIAAGCVALCFLGVSRRYSRQIR